MFKKLTKRTVNKVADEVEIVVDERLEKYRKIIENNAELIGAGIVVIGFLVLRQTPLVNVTTVHYHIYK